MPTTNRPFFANFFAAFRAQSAFPKASSVSLSQQPSASASTASAAAAGTSGSLGVNATSVTTTSTTSPRQISTNGVAAQAAREFSSLRQASSSSSAPRSQPDGRTHTQPQPPTSTATSPLGGGFQRSRTPSETRMSPRRPSDASNSESSPGVKDALGGQNWYIGGRTATGEERFYQLGVIKRYSSADRMSLDRLSL